MSGKSGRDQERAEGRVGEVRKEWVVKSMT